MSTFSINGLALVVASLGLLSPLLGGCGYSEPKRAAERVLAQHFHMIATNGYDAAAAHYGKPFFEKTRPEDWSKELAKLNLKLGHYQGHEVLWWRVFETTGPFGPGTTVNVQCEVYYSRHSAIETFTLFKPAHDANYKIAGHQIALEEFLKDTPGS